VTIASGAPDPAGHTGRRRRAAVLRVASTFVLHGFQVGYPAFVTYLAATMASPAAGSEVVFFLSVGSLILVGLEYGFRYSGAREIALALDEPGRIASVLAAIFLVQLAAMVAAMLACWAGVTWYGAAIGHGTALAVIGFMTLNGVVPTWIFIALSLQKEFLLYTLSVRVVGLAAALLCFVRHDLAALFVVQCATMLAIHGAGVWLLRRRGYVGFAYPFARLFALAGRLLRDGRDIFVMKLGVFSYTSAGVLILGLVDSPEAVGAFGLCHRLVTALQQGSAPLFMSAYPLSIRYIAGERQLGRELLRLNAGAMLCSYGLSLALALGGPALVRLLGLDDYRGITACILILSPLPALIGTSTLLVNNVVLASRRDDIVRTVTLVAGMLGVPAYFVVARWLGLVGAAMTLTAIETLIAIAYLLICVRLDLFKHLRYWEKACAD
jgi:O-antigen/teichoic acid export membrane protein